MTLIRMKVDMQGGRYDGREWPGYNREIEVPDWEANDLINGGTAEPVDVPELIRGYEVLKVADPDFEKHLRRADGVVPESGDDDFMFEREEEGEAVEDYEDDFERDDDDSVVTEEVDRPAPYAKKDAWIDYAVAKGADRKQVSELTTKQIQSRY